MPPKYFIVDAALFDLIGRYLLTRPMGEVEGLVNGMRQSQSYAPPEAQDSDTQKVDTTKGDGLAKH